MIPGDFETNGPAPTVPRKRATAKDVLRDIDLRGWTAVVTGASRGLGLEAACSLAAAGGEVVCAVLGDERQQTASAIESRVPRARYDVVTLDLRSIASVGACAAEISARHPRVDALINNAGVFEPRPEVTVDGFELHLGVNYLGHYVLTRLLSTALVGHRRARIVNISSRAHQESDIRWEDPHFRSTPFSVRTAYGQSKTAMLLFTIELERRLAPLGVHSFAVNPGAVATGLTRHLSLAHRRRLLAAAAYTEEVAVDVGAATIVFAAASGELAELGGLYLFDCQAVDRASYAPYASDARHATRLWDWSADQVASIPGSPIVWPEHPRPAGVDAWVA